MDGWQHTYILFNFSLLYFSHVCHQFFFNMFLWQLLLLLSYLDLHNAQLNYCLIKLFHLYLCIHFKLSRYLLFSLYVFLCFFQLNPTEPQPVPAFLPAHLNNKPICDDIIRKFSPSRRLESRELAKLLAQPHFRVTMKTISFITFERWNK